MVAATSYECPVCLVRLAKGTPANIRRHEFSQKHYFHREVNKSWREKQTRRLMAQS